MRGPTHALAGACTAGLFLAFNIPHSQPLILLSAVSGFAALLPDLDNTQSMAENITILGIKPLKGPAFIFEKIFKHRGYMHSLLAVALVCFILLGFLPQIPKDVDLAIIFGYLSHLVTDGITVEGVPWFYPLETFRTILPRFLRITTGSLMENLFFVSLIVLYVIILQAAGYIDLPARP